MLQSLMIHSHTNFETFWFILIIFDNDVDDNYIEQIISSKNN
jgi:hypothetical protein